MGHPIKERRGWGGEFWGAHTGPPGWRGRPIKEGDPWIWGGGDAWDPEFWGARGTQAPPERRRDPRMSKGKGPPPRFFGVHPR